MAHKRTAQAAFGASHGRLSAFAAARQKLTGPTPASEFLTDAPRTAESDQNAATQITGALYDLDATDNSLAVEETSAYLGEKLSSSSKGPFQVQLSTFRPGPSNVLRDDDEGLEIKLRVNETVTILGIFDLEVTSGVVSIYGAILRPTLPNQRVYTPSTHALPPITAKTDGTVLRITSVTSGLAELDRLSPLFRNIWANAETSPRSFSLLVHSSDDQLQRYLHPLELDEDSKRVLAALSLRLGKSESTLSTMAIGTKSTGKSTFNRLLSNMIISRSDGHHCLFLDLDPGQPEFGPPGQVSLVEVTQPILGPPFTHPAASSCPAFRLLRSHTLAATTFRDDPDHYTSCAVDLISHAPMGMPLVVNACGWVAGLGAKVLIDLTKKLAITEIVALEPIENPVVTALHNLGCNVYKIPRRAVRPSVRAPAEHRTMQTMAYFHHKRGGKPGQFRWFDTDIGKTRPWIVDYANPDSGVAAIVSYGQVPRPDFLAEILNGMTVAIVVPEVDDLLTLGTIERTSKEGLPYLPASSLGFTPPLDPHASHCLGLALVRAIDVDSMRLHLVSPLSSSETAALSSRKVVLVRGGFDCPQWAYTESLLCGEKMSSDDERERPWVSERDPRVGIEGAIWRLRHPPTR